MLVPGASSPSCPDPWPTRRSAVRLVLPVRPLGRFVRYDRRSEPRLRGTFGREALGGRPPLVRPFVQLGPAVAVLAFPTSCPGGAGRARASGEMADAHGSGPCVRKDVGVQLPPCPLDRDIQRGLSSGGVFLVSHERSVRSRPPPNVVPPAASGGDAAVSTALAEPAQPAPPAGRRTSCRFARRCSRKCCVAESVQPRPQAAPPSPRRPPDVVLRAASRGDAAVSAALAESAQPAPPAERRTSGGFGRRCSRKYCARQATGRPRAPLGAYRPPGAHRPGRPLARRLPRSHLGHRSSKVHDHVAGRLGAADQHLSTVGQLQRVRVVGDLSGNDRRDTGMAHTRST